MLILDFLLGGIFVTILYPWKPKHEFLAKGIDRSQAGTLPMEESFEFLLWDLRRVS